MPRKFIALNAVLIAVILSVLAGVLFVATSSGAGSCGTRTAAFGWEANRLHNDGANLILPVTQAANVTSVAVDYSMTRAPGTPAGAWREVLAYMAANPTSLGAPPARQPTEDGAPGWGASSRDGAASHGGGMSGDIFAQAILKNAYSGQFVAEPLGLELAAGSRLVVHLDAVGAPVDAEAQGSVTYSLCSG